MHHNMSFCRLQAQMPSLLDWLKGFPALPDPPVACADKLMKAGYRSVKDIRDECNAKNLGNDSGISAVTAIIIHIAAKGVPSTLYCCT